MLTTPLLAVLALSAAHGAEITLDPSACGQAVPWQRYCDGGGAAGCKALAELQLDIDSAAAGTVVCAQLEGLIQALEVKATSGDLVLQYQGDSVLEADVEAGLQVRGGARVWIEPDPLDPNATLEVRGVGQGRAVLVKGLGSELHLAGATLRAGEEQAFDSALDGGVIRVEGDGQLELVDGVVTGGRGWFHGGGLFVDTNAAADVQGTSFEGNTAPNGGDIYAAGELTVEDASFQGGEAVDFGGAIHAADDLTVLRSDFVGRAVDKGGSIYVLGDGDETVILQDLTITGGEAVRYGGGIYVRQTQDLTIERVQIHDVDVQGVDETGFVSDGLGGAIYVEGVSGTGDVTLVGVEVENAQAYRGGAFAAVAMGRVEVFQSAFRSTSAVDRGGALHFSNNGRVDVEGSAFCEVGAPLGGALYADGGDTTVSGSLVMGVASTAPYQTAAAFQQFSGALVVERTSLFDVTNLPAYAPLDLYFGYNVVRLAQPAESGNLDPNQLPVTAVVEYSLIEDSVGSSFSYPGTGVYVQPIDMLLGSALEPLPCGVEFRVDPNTLPLAFADTSRVDGHWGALGGTSHEPLLSLATNATGGTAVWADDADGDGYALAVDCNDDDPSVYPGAAEGCDGLDTNCDGLVDNVGPYAVGAELAFADNDGDGYGRTDDSKWVCDPASYALATVGGDCNDEDTSVHPGALEQCGDNIDQDCAGDGDGGAADPANAPSYQLDEDGDGYVVAGAEAIAYCVPPGTDGDAVWWEVGEVFGDGDCDDTSAALHPDAEEVCDGVDNDCDGLSDEADAMTADADLWYFDADTDRYGDDATATWFCDGAQPPGWVQDGGDCLDEGEGAELVFPGAFDTCDDGLDNDCDGEVDGGGEATWYKDGDGDGFFDADSAVVDCASPGEAWQPLESPPDAVDCDDRDADVHPGAEERCNRVDDDCDGALDEAVGDDGSGAIEAWPDGDGDGYGAGDGAQDVCRGAVPAGWVDNALDCDDSDPRIHPDAVESVGNEVDENCDGYLGDRWASGGGGCQTAPTSLGWALGLALGVLGWRRRA